MVVDPVSVLRPTPWPHMSSVAVGPTDTIDRCIELCCASTRCAAVSWNGSPYTREGQNYCYLKDNVASTTHNIYGPGVRTAYKPSRLAMYSATVVRRRLPGDEMPHSEGELPHPSRGELSTVIRSVGDGIEPVLGVGLWMFASIVCLLSATVVKIGAPRKRACAAEQLLPRAEPHSPLTAAHTPKSKRARRPPSHDYDDPSTMMWSACVADDSWLADMMPASDELWCDSGRGTKSGTNESDSDTTVTTLDALPLDVGSIMSHTINAEQWASQSDADGSESLDPLILSPRFDHDSLMDNLRLSSPEAPLSALLQPPTLPQQSPRCKPCRAAAIFDDRLTDGKPFRCP
eukprot:SAG11_NODE_2635_length_3149_cov_2.532787_4_plen_346_part_00